LRPSEKHTLNHKNGITSDNRVENLEWATPKEQLEHAYKIGLRKGSKKQRIVFQVNSSGEIIKEFPSLAEAARSVGGVPPSISYASKHGTSYREFRWKVKEKVNEPYVLPGEIWKKSHISDKFEVSSFGRVRDKKILEFNLYQKVAIKLLA
jgi:hypothetical protein